MDHKQLLVALGGPHAVHSALVDKGLKITQIAVRAWALPGRTIPAKYWAHIQDVAKDKGKDVSFVDLAESVKASPDTPNAA